MLYPIEAYDKNGLLKPSPLLWLVMLFSAKGWVVFVMAGASRQQGAKILELLYPIPENLYLAMAIGLPSLLLMWLAGLRHKNNKFINIIWQQGKWILLAAYITDCALQMHQLLLTHGEFSWTRAVSMLLTLWLGSYLLRSSRVRHTFADKPIER
ncbi:membrane protein [Photobacterium aquae]|uniref:Membrane protein n=1 Tax=Photobacterium aquae TaxID=1195763 RepID=A0A0J1H2C3_9GAMM|nr:membrane protein [Photobacterium aquae]